MKILNSISLQIFLKKFFLILFFLIFSNKILASESTYEFEINGNQNKQEINNIIQKMKENEIDIINNKITNETMMRQKEILNKLLKAEESQNEQEEDQTKESNEWIWETNQKTSYEKLEEQAVGLLIRRLLVNEI